MPFGVSTIAIGAASSASGGDIGLFSVTPYTGTGSAQSIVTGQNLTSGSMVWIKNTTGTFNHEIYDTVRGTGKFLITNSPAVEQTEATSITAFTSSGVSIGAWIGVNTIAESFTIFSWLKRAGFLDIVTYTGNGSNRTINHSLGTIPSLIIVKCTTNAESWAVYHSANTANPETDRLLLDSDVPTADDATYWNDTSPTSSVFSVGTSIFVNNSGEDYIAYLFAERAGLSKFGSYVGNYTGVGVSRTVSGVGFTPKAVLLKKTTSSGNWILAYSEGSNMYYIVPNSTVARTSTTEITFNSDGFEVTDTTMDNLGSTYIYAAWK